MYNEHISATVSILEDRRVTFIVSEVIITARNDGPDLYKIRLKVVNKKL